MEQFFKNFLVEISPAVQTLLVTLVTVLLGQAVAYLQKQYGIAKSQLTSEQQYFLDLLAQRAVEMVKQVYESESNQQKKEIAISSIENALAQTGFVIDADVIADAVEAQVFRLKN